MRHLKIVTNQVKIEPSNLDTTRLGQTVKMILEIESFLEFECCFRDYEIVPAGAYGTLNEIGQHILIKKGDNIEHILSDAIEVFCRDGYPTIYIYV